MAHPRPCPVCGADLIPLPQAPGARICPNGHGEWLPNEMAEPAPTVEATVRPFRFWGSTYQQYYETNAQSARESTADIKAIPSHLKDMGVMGPLPPIVQSPNKGGHGSSKKRGGSKSGRKRKKSKKRKRYVAEQWQG